ncbi:PRC-barrel domain-containing protein [Teichococcus coralli]|nr:PRC-barrel domain-containing protein [Pseudoroseomonas coralli]
MKPLLTSTALAAVVLLAPQLGMAQSSQPPPRVQQGGTAQGGAAAGHASGMQGSSGSSVAQPGDTQSMEELRLAAQRLREAMQAMAQQPAGDRRDQAMAQARDALLETQAAMIRLPADLRKTDAWREAQQRAGQAQASLNARQPDQQQAQQAVDQLTVSLQGFDAGPVTDARYASALLDKNLVGSNNNDVAKVEDLVMDGNWRVRGAVIEWGGFLGLGERRAVVPISRISMPAGDDGRARLSMTREELERLPAYQSHKPG